MSNLHTRTLMVSTDGINSTYAVIVGPGTKWGFIVTSYIIVEKENQLTVKN